jgi:hypothetical protein
MTLIFTNNSNLRASSLVQKIKIEPRDVTMQFLLSRVIGNDYKVEFLLQINPSRAFKDPSISISNSNIDLVSLRNSILGKLTPLDRHYMILKEFNFIKATFYFDIALWLHDAMLNMRPLTQLTSFNRSFKFKIQMPPMILKEPTRGAIQELLIRRFRDYLNKNPSTNTWFVNLFPKGISDPLHKLLSDRFDYTYDYQSNTIIMKLKSFWITALIYALAQYSKISKDKARITKLQNPGDFFAVKTRGYSSKFDNPTLRSFMRDKFI